MCIRDRFELARYDASVPFGNQNLICLPHIAGLGIGGIENGVITEPYGMTVVAVLHLIFSGVLGAGGILHSTRYDGDLGNYPEGSRPKSLTSNGMIQINLHLFSVIT